MRRRNRKRVQVDVTAPPNLYDRYFEDRRREMDAYDRLPSWARKALRRTNNQFQAVELAKAIARGERPLDLVKTLEFCDRQVSKQNLLQLEQFSLLRDD
jgi:hypothetical protein